jgi:hypothetical protein
MIAALGQSTPVLALTEPQRYKTNGILGGLYELPECLYNVQNWSLNELQEKTETVFRDLANIKSHIASKYNNVLSISASNIKLLKSII